jgi:hypothetical protein
MRLIPPKPREVSREDDADAEASAWARGLHRQRRGLAITVLGNALLLGLLLGVPFLRGQSRARATFARQARFTSCLLGAAAREPVGLGAARDEAEHFAARLLGEGPRFVARCKGALEAVPADDAFFVLPSVKAAEARVREAVRVMRVELAALGSHLPGEALPDRPLRALAQLRDTVRAQGEAASVLDLPVHASVETGASLPRPARAPLYTARDAAIALWGDDHGLYAVALDKSGVSYLEVLAGRPLRRARLSRPAALRGLLRAERPLLLWSTPEARCKERVQGCYGKTSSLAPAPLPLFSLPDARLVAAHVAGRADRSLALRGDSLELAVANEQHGVSLAELPFPAETLFDPHLPALAPSQRAESHADLLLVTGSTQSFALASDVREGQAALTQLQPEGPRPLASFASAEAPWVVACARGDGLDFATGTKGELRIGRVRGAATTLWDAVALPTSAVVHASDVEKDAVRLSCADERAFALVRDAQHALTALVCSEGTSACRSKQLAVGAHAMTLLAVPGHMLVAHAGDDEHPQVLLTRLKLTDLGSKPSRAPAACWAGSRGLCGPPHLARLGTRVILAGHDDTDLSLLESADEGLTWTAPPVY